MTEFWKKCISAPPSAPLIFIALLSSFTLNLLLLYCWSHGHLSIFRLFDWLDINVWLQLWRDCLWLGWLIFDILLKGCPPRSLFFCLWHQSERMGSRHSEYQAADWGCHSGPQWTLVARCACPLVSAAGFVSWVCKGLSGWTDGAEEVAERSAVPH